MSHTTTVPGRHCRRVTYSGRVACDIRNSNRGRLSPGSNLDAVRVNGCAVDTRRPRIGMCNDDRVLDFRGRGASGDFLSFTLIAGDGRVLCACSVNEFGRVDAGKVAQRFLHPGAEIAEGRGRVREQCVASGIRDFDGAQDGRARRRLYLP